MLLSKKPSDSPYIRVDPLWFSVVPDLRSVSLPYMTSTPFAQFKKAVISNFNASSSLLISMTSASIGRTETEEVFQSFTHTFLAALFTYVIAILFS